VATSPGFPGGMRGAVAGDRFVASRWADGRRRGTAAEAACSWGRVGGCGYGRPHGVGKNEGSEAREERNTPVSYVRADVLFVGPHVNLSWVGIFYVQFKYK
jgi:hypothetical protein